MQHLRIISALFRLTGTISHLQVHVEGKFMTVLSLQWHFYVCTVNWLGKVNWLVNWLFYVNAKTTLEIEFLYCCNTEKHMSYLLPH